MGVLQRELAAGSPESARLAKHQPCALAIGLHTSEKDAYVIHGVNGRET